VPVLGKVLTRRLGPIGVALTVYDLWRHLPAKHRQRLLEQGKTQGARVARFVVEAGSTQIKKRRG
jgi:hypothetical protein